MLTSIVALAVASQQQFVPLGDHEDFVAPDFRSALAAQGAFAPWPKPGAGIHYASNSILFSVRAGATEYMPTLFKSSLLPSNLSACWKGYEGPGCRLYYRAVLPSGTKFQIDESVYNVSFTVSALDNTDLSDSNEAIQFLKSNLSEHLNVPNTYWQNARFVLKHKPLGGTRKWFRGTVWASADLVATVNSKPWWETFVVSTDGKVVIALFSRPEAPRNGATGALSLPGTNRFTGG